MKLFDTSIDITSLITIYSQWTTIDVSGYIPDDNVSGVILLVRETVGGSTGQFSARKTGSTFDIKDELVRWGQHHWCVGVDANKQFDIYTSSTNHYVHLMGYFRSHEAVFFTEPITLPDPPVTDSWQEYDVTAHVTAGTKGVMIHTTGTQNMGLRMNASSDDRRSANVDDSGFAICGLDANLKFEAWLDSTAQKLYLIGYFPSTSTMYFEVDRTDISTSTTDSWHTVSAGAGYANRIICIEVYRGSNVRACIRKVGSTEDYYFQHVDEWAYWWVECDGSGDFEAYIDDTSVDFYICGNIQDTSAYPKIWDVLNFTEPEVTTNWPIIFEALSLIDLPMPNVNPWDTPVADAFTLADLSAWAWEKLIADSFSGADVSSEDMYVNLIIAEVLSGVDLSSAIGDLYKSALDSTFIWDHYPGVGWGHTIADATTITDLPLWYLGLLIADHLFTADAVFPTFTHRYAAIADSTFIYDYVQLNNEYLKTLADTFSNTDVASYEWTIRIIDHLFHADSATSIEEAYREIAEALTLEDVSEKGFGMTIADSTTILDTIAVLWFLAVLVADSLSFADVVTSPSPDLNTVVIDTTSLADVATNKGDFKEVVADEFSLSIRLKLDGTVYQCWLLNTDELMPSLYAGYAFNSFAQLGEDTYGAKDTGIYKLGGTADDGTAIKTGTRLNLYNMNSSFEKRILEAHFGLSGTTPVVKITNENGSVTYYVVKNRIVDLSKGHEGYEWILDIADINELDFVEILPALIRR